MSYKLKKNVVTLLTITIYLLLSRPFGYILIAAQGRLCMEIPTFLLSHTNIYQNGIFSNRDSDAIKSYLYSLVVLIPWLSFSACSFC